MIGDWDQGPHLWIGGRARAWGSPSEQIHSCHMGTLPPCAHADRQTDRLTTTTENITFQQFPCPVVITERWDRVWGSVKIEKSVILEL